MKTIAVLSGFDDLRALSREFPDAVINSVAELGIHFSGANPSRFSVFIFSCKEFPHSVAVALCNLDNFSNRNIKVSDLIRR